MLQIYLSFIKLAVKCISLLSSYDKPAIILILFAELLIWLFASLLICLRVKCITLLLTVHHFMNMDGNFMEIDFFRKKNMKCDLACIYFLKISRLSFFVSNDFWIISMVQIDLKCCMRPFWIALKNQISSYFSFLRYSRW